MRCTQKPRHTGCCSRNRAPPELFTAWSDYVRDATQRMMLTLDALRMVGSGAVARQRTRNEAEPVLLYDYALILDGQTLSPRVSSCWCIYCHYMVTKSLRHRAARYSFLLVASNDASFHSWALNLNSGQMTELEGTVLPNSIEAATENRNCKFHLSLTKVGSESTGGPVDVHDR